MKKRFLSLALALIMCLSLLPGMALAAEPGKLDAPIISNLRQGGEDFEGLLYYDLTWPTSVKNALAYYESIDAFEPMYIITEINVNGHGWVEGYTANASTLDEGERATSWDSEYDMATDHIQLRICLCDTYGAYQSSTYSNILEVNAAPYQASPWAEEWMAQADELGLIPDVLQGADLTKSITRAEFAAVCVKLYENLSGEKPTPAPDTTFMDTKDTEVLKAYHVGITKGTSATTFTPNAILSRQECATMLTRVYKKVAISGWTIDADASFDTQFKAMFTMPAKFADDAKIDSWAKDSVYFMKAKGIIDGVGNNMFAPKHGTTANEAASYGLATREQAIKIAVAVVQNLK